MEAEYDQMAEEYDATREAPTEQEIGAIAASLEGFRSVLDVGVGTGRFAIPVSGLGFDVTGVDVSRRMLLKAREKGLERLLLGDAYSLPFKDKSFDAAIIIHVLHVVADWAKVMREIGRVTRGSVITILRVPQVPEVPGATNTPNPTQAGGYPVRTQHRMWQNEQELKERVPPLKLERIRDETLSIPVAEAMRRLEAKRSFGAQMIPPEIKHAMMERIIAMSVDRVVHRRIVEDLAVWKADQLESLG
ncbi:MAG: methyltransferase domain-containing protein [Thaumarchaeota archaeon]|nr:methyltransferase domain-containing protein [Nitrososphaerota archaeon]